MLEGGEEWKWWAWNVHSPFFVQGYDQVTKRLSHLVPDLNNARHIFSIVQSRRDRGMHVTRTRSRRALEYAGRGFSRQHHLGGMKSGSGMHWWCRKCGSMWSNSSCTQVRWCSEGQGMSRKGLHSSTTTCSYKCYWWGVRWISRCWNASRVWKVECLKWEMWKQ